MVEAAAAVGAVVRGVVARRAGAPLWCQAGGVPAAHWCRVSAALWFRCGRRFPVGFLGPVSSASFLRGRFLGCAGSGRSKRRGSLRFPVLLLDLRRPASTCVDLRGVGARRITASLHEMGPSCAHHRRCLPHSAHHAATTTQPHAHLVLTVRYACAGGAQTRPSMGPSAAAKPRCPV